MSDGLMEEMQGDSRSQIERLRAIARLAEALVEAIDEGDEAVIVAAICADLRAALSGDH